MSQTNEQSATKEFTANYSALKKFRHSLFSDQFIPCMCLCSFKHSLSFLMQSLMDLAPSLTDRLAKKELPVSPVKMPSPNVTNLSAHIFLHMNDLFAF